MVDMTIKNPRRESEECTTGRRQLQERPAGGLPKICDERSDGRLEGSERVGKIGIRVRARLGAIVAVRVAVEPVAVATFHGRYALAVRIVLLIEHPCRSRTSLHDYLPVCDRRAARGHARSRADQVTLERSFVRIEPLAALACVSLWRDARLDSRQRELFAGGPPKRRVARAGLSGHVDRCAG